MSVCKRLFMKIKETATIISQECLSVNVYSMWLETGIAAYAQPGQFISVYPDNAAMLLPRPISICETGSGADTGKLRIVYRIAGEGTKLFSKKKAGDQIDILGPNGNGFLAVSGELSGKTRALLIGGGIGIPPMVELAKRLTCDVTTVAGYRNADEMFLTKELESEGRLLVSTDDGSFGTKGTVIDAVKENGVGADVIFACGPAPMLRGVKALSGSMGIPAYVSMEERMACGVGACLACVCTSTDTDDHSKVNNKRVCADGPVFPVSEVVL